MDKIKIGCPVIVSNDLSYAQGDLISGDGGIIILDIHNKMNLPSAPDRYKYFYILINKNKKKYWVPITDIEIDVKKIRREKLKNIIDV